MKAMKKLAAALLALSMLFALAACSGGAANSPSPSVTPSDSAEPTDPGESKTVYTVGICQLAPHVALDAATQGFKDALVEKLGEDGVKIEK